MAGTSRLDQILDVKIDYGTDEECPICGHDHYDNVPEVARAKFKEQIKLLFLEVIGEHKKVLLARYEDEDSEAARENNEKLDLVIFHLDKVGKLVEAL